MLLSKIPNTNSQILIATAQSLGINVDLLDEEKLKLKLTKDGKTHIVTKKSYGINPVKAIKQTRNKRITHQLLDKLNIPYPEETEMKSIQDLEKVNLPKFPLVVKPSEGEKGHDVYIGIKNRRSLENTARQAIKHSNSLIIQKYIKADDFRFFILSGKIIGVVRRHPPVLTGDGNNTIKDLIETHNQRLLEERKKTGRRMQNRMLNWPRIIWHIENQGLTLNSIVPKDKKLVPYPIANFQAGGTVETISLNDIHTSIIDVIEKTAHATGLTVCGIDALIKDYTQPAIKGSEPLNIAVLEVNSDPSLRLHEWPNSGKPQPVTEKLLKFIFSS